MTRYSIIYADPPWRYRGGKGKNSAKWGNSLASYPCMELEELKELPVADLADDNCALFLWVTWPMYAEGLELINAWGFEYKTCAFVWAKTYNNGDPYCGMGYWTRSGSEYCLLAFRGELERQSNTVYQIIEAPVEGHSKKPDEARERIVELLGDLPRIELFARQRFPGWNVWGNEVIPDVDMPITNTPLVSDEPYTLSLFAQVQP